MVRSKGRECATKYRISKDFLNWTLVVQKIRPKLVKGNPIKSKSQSKTKRLINQANRDFTEQLKVSASFIANRGLLSKVTQRTTTKQTNKQLKHQESQELNG